MKEILDYKIAKEMATKNVGLTYNEIEKVENGIYFKYYQGNCRMPEDLAKKDKKTLKEWEEDKKVLQELRFRRWCNSCLTYGNTYEFDELDVPDTCMMGKTTLEQYNTTMERAKEVIKQQKERFKTAVVIHNVYTDSEGCTYNSVEWD